MRSIRGIGTNSTVVGSVVGSVVGLGFTPSGLPVSVVAGSVMVEPSGAVPASEMSVTSVPVLPSGFIEVPVAVATFSTPPALTSAGVIM